MATPKSVEVQLAFTGICVFLRGDDGWPAAVMPNARVNPHGDHIPWLMINKKNWDGTTPFDMEKGDFGAWFLGDEDMWLDASQQGAVTKYDDHDYGEDPTPGDAASIHWTTPARSLLDSLELNDPFRKPGDAKAVSLWFHLPEGVLRTVAVRDCVWELRDDVGSKPRLTQSLAQETALVTDVPAFDNVVLSSVDMGTGEVRRRTLILDGASSIRVLIGNTPKDDVFPPNIPPEDVDHHFMIYRQVFKNAPGPKEWPIPHKVQGRCPDDALVRVSRAMAPERAGGHNCPPLLVF